jgi:uncharacterized OB-fold protein
MTHPDAPDPSRAHARVSIREDLLTGSLSDLATIRLAGCRCDNCGETSLGRKVQCPNCGRETVHDIPLSPTGTLWTFTVARHRPPGDYRGPEPFSPFGLGLVELPEGLRVLSPLDADVDALRIGMPMRFAPYVRTDPDGREVVAFTFVPVDPTPAGRGGAA